MGGEIQIPVEFKNYQQRYNQLGIFGLTKDQILRFESQISNGES